MNKLLNQIAELAWVKVIVIALVCGVVYFFGFRDDGSTIKTSLEQTQTELKAAQSALASTKKAMENAVRFEKEVLLAKAQFEKVGEFMPPKISVADLTSLISEKATRSSVRLLSTTPKSSSSPEKVAAAIYDTIRVSFKIEGSFAQILAFLSQISRDSRLLTFDNTELSTVNGTAVDEPSLDFSGDIVGYRYKPTAAPKPTTGSTEPKPAADSPVTTGDPNAKK